MKTNINLKQALHYGLVLKKVHRVLKFNQSSWMKSYIKLNTTHRLSTSNEFEKNVFKLLNDAVYGKTMENIRKQRDVKMITKWEGKNGAKSYVTSPFFKSSKIFSQACVAIELYKSVYRLNNPISIGMAIQEIFQSHMYEFHYGHMKQTFGDDAQLMYTDADSFIYNIHNCDIYESMKQYSQKFDTCDFSEKTPCDIVRANSRVPGLMKDTNNGSVMTEFIGLRSKTYGIRVKGRNPIKKAKEIKGHNLRKDINCNEFLNCLTSNCIISKRQNTIISKLQNFHTQKQTNIALSPFDAKRYAIPNSTLTLPWGHYSI